MRLNKITIKNFGIYNGDYTYDFSVTPEKNVVLVSGRNGSGKTTLLNIVKLSIYGPKLFGSATTTNKQYLNYILSNLNAFALHNGQSDFEVGIDFSMFYNNAYRLFKINRLWSLNEDKLKEQTSLSIDNEKVDDYQVSTVLETIHRTIPKTLFELFFFDGEKINDMFNLKTDLSDMLNHVYNLNLFIDLKKDLRVYRGRISTTKELSECESDIDQLEVKINAQSAELEKLDEQLATEKIRLAQTEEELQITKEQFQNFGGLNSEEQLLLKKQINQLEQTKSTLESQYKQLVEWLPFVMMAPQLHTIAKQVKVENEAYKYSILADHIDQNELKTYLLNSFTENQVTNLLDSIKQFAHSKLTDSHLYEFTDKDEAFLIGLLNDIGSLSSKDLENCIHDIATTNEELRQLNVKLHESASEELRLYSANITRLSNEIGNIETTVKNLAATKENLITQMKTLTNELHQLYKQRKELHKEGNLENVIFKIESVIESYSKRLKHTKQKQFEAIISEMFTTLIRKEDFISGIKINEETGEIQIFNKLGGLLPKENLSAGERQIYILSILFGIVSLSRNKVPLVFDTLLGRLDHTHKTHIVHSFIKQCGEQVIILATDTEIDEQYLSLLKPLINNYYTIDYDSTNNTVLHQKISLD